MKQNIWISVVFKNVFQINNFVMKFFIRTTYSMKLAKFVNAPM